MNDINLLMSRIADINSKHPTELTPSDIDDLIIYHRRNRQRKAAGEKPISTGGERITDLSAMLNLPKPKSTPAISSTTITRRV